MEKRTKGKNKVIIITGPSGSGKTSIARYLLQRYHIPKVITHTTRPPRQGEINGRDYYFEEEKDWSKVHFIEQVKYSNYYYGSSYKGLQQAWKKSKKYFYISKGLISLIVDTNGAITYKNLLKKRAIIWFVTITNTKSLKNRLFKRGDNPKLISERTNSSDFIRDIDLPKKIKNESFLIINDVWPLTKKKLDTYIKII